MQPGAVLEVGGLHYNRVIVANFIPVDHGGRSSLSVWKCPPTEGNTIGRIQRHKPVSDVIFSADEVTQGVSDIATFLREQIAYDAHSQIAPAQG